jgi:hypothetical protein
MAFTTGREELPVKHDDDPVPSGSGPNTSGIASCRQRVHSSPPIVRFCAQVPGGSVHGITCYTYLRAEVSRLG